MLATVGQRPSFEFAVKDHLQLGEDLDLIDFETGGVVRLHCGGSGGGSERVLTFTWLRLSCKPVETLWFVTQP